MQTSQLLQHMSSINYTMVLGVGVDLLYCFDDFACNNRMWFFTMCFNILQLPCKQLKPSEKIMTTVSRTQCLTKMIQSIYP